MTIIDDERAFSIPALRIPDVTPGHRRFLESQVLALSDERDQWEAYALALAETMYRQGFADGERAEQLRADAAFAVAAPRRVDGPTHAELTALRASHGPLCRCAEHSGADA